MVKDLKNDVSKIFEFIFLNDNPILLTLVSVVTVERPFSKLKLIKNYLMPTISQERMSDLFIISTESATLDEIRIHHIIKKMLP